METFRGAMLAGTRTLAVLAAVLLSTTAGAGPLGNIAGTLTLHRATGAQRASAVSLAGLPGLRTTLGSSSRAQLSLDTLRLAALDLHEARAPAPATDDSAAAMHSPRGLHWEDASAPVNPHLISLARNYHHDGLPVVKLWQADRNMVSIGLNPHGVPGLFFTQTMGK